MKYLLFSALGAVAFLGFSITPVYQKDSGQKKCTECHSDIIKFKKLHPAMEDGCETCHQPEGPSHPDKDGFTLTKKVPALCFVCHDTFNKKFIHPPASEGACLSCHSPHGSDYPDLLVEPKEKLCMECHDKEVPPNYRAHFSYFESSCNDCHDAHQSNNTSLLKKPVPDLCFQCHEKEIGSGGEGSIHNPYSEGSCVSCHQPHGSGIPELLTQSIPTLCFNCHEQITPAYPHEPVKKGKCMACHNPHASGQDNLLIKKNKELCLTCHSQSYRNDSAFVINIGQLLTKNPYIHGAIEMDGCSGCHAGHGTKYQELLQNKYPSGYYTEGKAENFALCFNCHDASLLEKDASVSGTNFRNGNLNLHYIHVNGTNGRSCSLCHEVHAGRNEQLIKEKVSYGDWTMNMNYKATKNGGSCMPGCHGELKYNRNIEK